MIKRVCEATLKPGPSEGGDACPPSERRRSAHLRCCVQLPCWAILNSAYSRLASSCTEELRRYPKEMLNTAHEKSLSNCQTDSAYQIACNLLYITPAKADRWNLSAAAAIGRFETRPSCLLSRLHSFVKFIYAWEFRGILHLLYLVPLQRLLEGMPPSHWNCTGCSEGHSSWKLFSSWNLKAKSETANLKMHSRTLKTWNINHFQL